MFYCILIFQQAKQKLDLHNLIIIMSNNDCGNEIPTKSFKNTRATIFLIIHEWIKFTLVKSILNSICISYYLNEVCV